MIINPFIFGATLWTPANITTLAWYDASDTGTITSSLGKVSQWDDKSGNTRHLTQGTGAYQPTTGSATMNGLNAIAFDGTDDRLNAPAGLPNAFTYFFVFEVSAASRVFMYAEQSGSNTKNSLSCQSNTLVFDQYLPSGNSIVSPTLSGNNLVVVRQSATNSRQLFYNGNADGTSTEVYSGTAPTAFYIGARVSSLEPFDKPIAEIVFFSSALSTGDRQKTEGYLAHKWGLTGKLPSGHPYKSTPPYV
jgi:hypothetical protein